MKTRILGLIVVVATTGQAVHAQVVIETVFVGNPGNAGENSGASEPGGSGPDRICGVVDYLYNIGKYEVTAGQYTEFLNAVADDDTYELYNTKMWSDSSGCKIERTGSAPNYSYSVAPDWADRPVNYVSWGDAARFANWLHNGQPTGAQDLSTTEDGSYYLNGAMSNVELTAVVREPDATWVTPSEDEWYKAAYHHNDGVTSNYYDYPTGSDSVPSNVLADPDPGNNANYYAGWTIGAPYYRTIVGDFENSESPYGTFDQGGNVSEWVEEVIDSILMGAYQSARGGACFSWDNVMHAAHRAWVGPPYEADGVGFRVVDLIVLGACCDGATCTEVSNEAECVSGVWLGEGTSCDPDCDEDGTVDVCAIAQGISNDCNADGLPDECATFATAQLEPDPYRANRTITFGTATIGEQIAIEVFLADLPAPFDTGIGQSLWVGEPFLRSENGASGPPIPGFVDIWVAELQCEPVYLDWTFFEDLRIFHEFVIPGATYEIRAVPAVCATNDPANFSAPVVTQTAQWGDVTGSFDVETQSYRWPDGSIDVATDVVAQLDKFRSLDRAPSKARTELEPSFLDWCLCITDVTVALDAFKGAYYPYSPHDPIPCP